MCASDKETGLSKGSAFVKFEDASAAEAAVLAGSYVRCCTDILHSDCKLTTHCVFKQSMGGMSGATARGPVYVSGKPTRIDMAVDRDQARRLEDGKDKRGIVGVS